MNTTTPPPTPDTLPPPPDLSGDLYAPPPRTAPATPANDHHSNQQRLADLGRLGAAIEEVLAAQDATLDASARMYSLATLEPLVRGEIETIRQLADETFHAARRVRIWLRTGSW